MIYVDADSCPVKDIILKVAKEYNEKVIFYFDQSHYYESDYAIVRIVEKDKDSVDMYILKEIKENEILVTGDYGLGALALAKKALVITPNGLILDNNNIDFHLTTRYEHAIARKANKHVKGPRKRKSSDDEKFEVSLRKLLEVYNA